VVDWLGDWVVDDCPVDWLLVKLLVIKMYCRCVLRCSRSWWFCWRCIGLAGATGLVTLGVAVRVWAGRLVVSGACPKAGAEQSSSDALTAKYSS